MYDFISGLFFYIFAFTTLSSAIMVVSVKNPVHAILFLIMTFFSTAGLFILIGAEFIAMTLVIVYVGAIAVLFLFVVMMMNVNLEKIKFGLNNHIIIFAGLSLILLVDLLFIIISSVENISIKFNSNIDKKMTNTHEIGQLLYTDYIYHFEIAGLILFIAMIGSIVLTFRDKKTSYKQNRSKQLLRNVENSIKIVKVPTGVGLDGIIDQ